MVSTRGHQGRAGVGGWLFVTAACPAVSCGLTCLVLLLFWAWSETQLKPRCYLQGLMLKGEVLREPAWDSQWLLFSSLFSSEWAC